MPEGSHRPCPSRCTGPNWPSGSPRDRQIMTDRSVTGDPSHAVTGDPFHAVIGDPSHAVIGDAPRRREDARFVTGHGTYLDDLRFDGVTHAVFVRSPHAHARINAIDIEDALTCPGVLA